MDAICTLNDLYCNGGEAAGPSSEAQCLVLQELRAVVDSAGSPPQKLHENEALCALLHQDVQYSEDGGSNVGALATFGAAAVSVPLSVHSAPLATSVLPAEKAPVLEGFREHMLLSDSQYAERVEREGLPGLYMDPVLKRSRKKYLEFVKLLASRGILSFHRHADEHVGVFFVGKKSGELRFICDARKTNARFKAAPPVSLPSGEALARTRSAPGSTLFGAGLDLRLLPQLADPRIDEDLFRIAKRSSQRSGAR